MSVHPRALRFRPEGETLEGRRLRAGAPLEGVIHGMISVLPTATGGLAYQLAPAAGQGSSRLSTLGRVDLLPASGLGAARAGGELNGQASLVRSATSPDQARNPVQTKPRENISLSGLSSSASLPSRLTFRAERVVLSNPLAYRAHGATPVYRALADGAGVATLSLPEGSPEPGGSLVPFTIRFGRG